MREWQQKFDAGTNAAQAERIKSETPLLSPETVAAIEAAIPQLQAQQARGGWPKIKSSMRLKVGSRSDAGAASA